jgi:hypothetical protein
MSTSREERPLTLSLILVCIVLFLTGIRLNCWKLEKSSLGLASDWTLVHTNNKLLHWGDSGRCSDKSES